MAREVKMAQSQKIEICIVVFIGLPGSGKTTLSKTLNDYFEKLNNSEGKIINCVFPICYDDLIPVAMVKWQEDNPHWRNARKNVLNYVAKLIRYLKGLDECCMLDNVDLSVKDKVLAFKNCSNQSRVYIIIDDNMYYRSMRYEYYQLARLYNTSFCQIYIQCSVNVALNQNSSRKPSEVVPDEIILKMFKKLEPPNIGNSWENLSFTISEQWNPERIEDIYQFLNEVANYPVYKHEDNSEIHAESRAICSSSVLHQIDVVLRKLVGERMRESKQAGLAFELLRNRARLLADVRRHIMDGIKTERIEVPEEIQENIKCNNSESRNKLTDFLNDFFALHQL